MPATHLTFANDVPVFPTDYGKCPAPAAFIRLDQAFLWQYGVTRVPLSVWNVMRRMAAWIEPMLIAEWVRLTKAFADGLGKPVTADAVLAALRWIEPDRDTGFVRGIAQRRLARGETISCVWSGKPILASGLEIDHCLPWSAWPCGDLWNLLPSEASVNRQKREKIVSASRLAQARPLILDWWQTAYLEEGSAVRARFTEEAQTTLPLPSDGTPCLDDLFLALDFRRLRLRQETQAAEWAGLR